MSKGRANTAEKTAASTVDYRATTTRRGRSMLAREGIVRVAVAGTILLVLAMMALLWQHWSSVREPTTAIVIHGDPSLDGARITVESNDDSSEPKVNVTLGQDRKFDPAIFRYPGQYKVTIEYPQKGGTVSYIVTVDHRRGSIIDLPTTVKINAQPGDKVTVTNIEGDSQTATFDSKNTRATFLLMPGKYTLVRTRFADPQPPQELVVESHTPHQIDLPTLP